VRRLVDLRFEGEELDEPALPEEIEVVAVSLFGHYDPELGRAFDDRIRAASDVASVFADGYIRTLAETPDVVAAAVAAVADSERADGVVIHCFAGKDRTGIVSALLLGVAGVPDGLVAADYAESGPNVMPLFDGWIAASTGEAEKELRQRLAQAPAATMLAVMGWLREHAGSAAGYLREAGLSDAQLTRLRARLVEG
jgi:protein-tyrosine phosphatase